PLSSKRRMRSIASAVPLRISRSTWGRCRRTHMTSSSTASRDATSPLACPPTPSATTYSPTVSSHKKKSSLCCRRLPTSENPAEVAFTASILENGPREQRWAKFPRVKEVEAGLAAFQVSPLRLPGPAPEGLAGLAEAIAEVLPAAGTPGAPELREVEKRWAFAGGALAAAGASAFDVMAFAASL